MLPDTPETGEEIEAPGAPASTNGHAPVSLDAILNATDKNLAVRAVDVPEWDMTVKVRSLTRGELMRVLTGVDQDDLPTVEASNARAMAAAMTEPVVTVEQAALILETKSMEATQRIMDAIYEVAGMAPGFRPGKEDPVRS